MTRARKLLWPAIAAYVLAAGATGAAETVIASKEFPRAGVRALAVTTDAGFIDVRGTEAGDAKVESVRPAHAMGHCQLIADLKDGRLSLEARRPAGSAVACDAGFRVALPRPAAVEAYAGSGGVTVAGLRGETKIRTASGAIRVDGVEAPVHVLTGSGGVSVRAPRTPWLDVRATSGGVAVSLGSSRSTVSLRTGAGGIAVTVPRGVAARVKARSGSGSVDNRLPKAQDAALTIEALSGSGRIRLSPGGP